MVSEWEVNLLPFSKHSRRSEFVAYFCRDIFFPILYRSWQRNQFKVVISYIIVLNYRLRHLFSCFNWNQVASVDDVKPVSNCFRVVVCLNSSLEKFSWLVQRWFFFYSWRSICCLNLIFIEIWSISNQMNLRHVMFCRTIASVWKLPEVKVKHCGLVPLTQSEAGACDQLNFVENWIGHDR